MKGEERDVILGDDFVIHLTISGKRDYGGEEGRSPPSRKRLLAGWQKEDAKLTRCCDAMLKKIHKPAGEEIPLRRGKEGGG